MPRNLPNSLKIHSPERQGRRFRNIDLGIREQMRKQALPDIEREGDADWCLRSIRFQNAPVDEIRQCVPRCPLGSLQNEIGVPSWEAPMAQYCRNQVRSSLVVNDVFD